MANTSRSSRALYPIIGAVVIVAIAVLLNLLMPYGTWLDYLVRGLAICAYLLLLASILSARYVRELVRFFGKPFIKVHHIATVAALALMVLHAVFVAINSGTLSVFVPIILPVRDFIAYGGRVALYLTALGSLAALLRRVIAGFWRYVHWLSYLAFLLATTHGMLLGSSFQSPGVRIVAVLLAVAATAAFVLKRVQQPKRRTLAKPA